jgi:hypothetical protein
LWGVKPPQIHEDDVVFLEAEQLNQLADEIEPRFRAMVLLAGYRGPRWGELAGLRRARVNPEKGTVEIAEILVEVAGAFSFAPEDDQGPEDNPASAVPPRCTRRTHPKARRWRVRVHQPEGQAAPPVELRPALLPSCSVGCGAQLRSYVPRAPSHSRFDPGGRGAQLNELATVMGWSRSTVAAMAVRYAHLFPSRQEHLTARLEAVFRGAEAQRSRKSDDILMTTSADERTSQDA